MKFYTTLRSTGDFDHTQLLQTFLNLINFISCLSARSAIYGRWWKTLGDRCRSSWLPRTKINNAIFFSLLVHRPHRIIGSNYRIVGALCGFSGKPKLELVRVLKFPTGSTSGSCPATDSQLGPQSVRTLLRVDHGKHFCFHRNLIHMLDTKWLICQS